MVRILELFTRKIWHTGKPGPRTLVGPYRKPENRDLSGTLQKPENDPSGTLQKLESRDLFFFFFCIHYLRRHRFLIYKFTNSTMNVNS